MLSRFFKRKTPKQSDLNHDDRNRRLDALATLDEPSDAETAQIETLARSDSDADVRRSAIAKTANIALLVQLLEDKDVAESAARRLVVLEPETQRQHPAITAALLASGVVPQAAQLDQASPEQLVELVITSRGEARSQLLARPLFQQPATLTILERQSRTKDKSLNRFAREHLDRFRRHRQDYELQQQRLEELLSALDKHLRSDATATGFQQKHQQLRDRAQETLARLEKTAAALPEDDHRNRSLTDLQQQVNKLPAPAEPASIDATADDPFVALSQEFKTLEADLRRSSDFETLQQRRHMLTDRWFASSDARPPDDTQHALFQRVTRDCNLLADAVAQLSKQPPIIAADDQLPERPPKNLQATEEFWRTVAGRKKWLSQSNRFLEQLQWPEWAGQPENLTALREAVSTVSEQLSRIEAHSAGLLDKLSANVKELNEKIANGESKAAQNLLNSARTLVKALPRADTDKLNRSLNQAAAQLGELKDWQTFATTPKRQGLCEEMTSLAEQPLSPADQASRIKTLREHWNELGPATTKVDRDLAGQFNTLAERAFEPCRAFYSDQAQQREDNLKARVDICEQLSAYLESTDWSHTDVKAAEQIMRTARTEWQRYHPVDRKPGKPLEERFETLQNALHSHIRAEWEGNLALKQQLVADAKALLEESVPVPTRVDGAKNLQQRWRDIGPTPRRPDQQLWQEFRAVCDQIFESRDSEKRAADEEIEAGRNLAQQLLDEFAASLNEDFERGSLRALQQAFADLPALPERIRRPIQQRFEDLQRSAEQLVKRQAKAQRVLELEQRLAEDVEAGDVQASEDEVRRQVIEAEIAADLESDPADRELRMAIQVDLMNQGRGQQALSADAKDLVNQWLALGAKPPGCEPLLERFQAAIRKLSED
jgi:hypothetical protein